MPLWKNISRVFYFLMLKTLSLVLIILPLWAYELLGTFCFFSISCAISVSSVCISYPNCPVLGLFLIVLNSEALKLMVSVCHTNKCVYYLCSSSSLVPGGKLEPSLPLAIQQWIGKQAAFQSGQLHICLELFRQSNQLHQCKVSSVCIIIWFGFSPDAGLDSSISFILSEIKGKFTKK